MGYLAFEQLVGYQDKTNSKDHNTISKDRNWHHLSYSLNINLL